MFWFLNIKIAFGEILAFASENKVHSSQISNTLTQYVFIQYFFQKKIRHNYFWNKKKLQIIVKYVYLSAFFNLRILKSINCVNCVSEVYKVLNVPF